MNFCHSSGEKSQSEMVSMGKKGRNIFESDLVIRISDVQGMGQK